MKQKHEIEQQVDETLRSLDQVERAKANPFLFTRVQARLSASPKTIWETLTSYLSKPVIAMAMLCMVILTNAAVVYWQAGPDDMVAVNDQQQLALTEEYHITVASIYEDETPEP
jgi:hypothetical protein